MRGALGLLEVNLQASDVGMQTGWTFPYVGYGYAWVRRFEGNISGHPVELTASKVEMEKKHRFPHQGYGYGWTQEMTGRCGDEIILKLSVTEVAKDSSYMFPYFGFGFAWAKRGILTLSTSQY